MRAIGLLLAAALVLQLAVILVLGERHALSDVAHYVHLRGVRPGAPPYLDRFVEYPVLTGVVIYLMSLVGNGVLGFFFAGAVISGALVVVVTVVLERRDSPHVLRWALGVPLLLYVFHNWDLLAVAPFVVGLAAYERGRDGLAGAAIGAGAAAKLFPGAALLPLAAVRYARGERARAAQLLAAAVAVIVVINGPVLIAAPDGWWWTARFQGNRPPTWGALWHYALQLPVAHDLAAGPGASVANALSIAALAGGVLFVSRCAVRRGLTAFEIGCAATGIFLLVNKVYSPQYDLWLVPFFAALPIDRRRWNTFWLADLGLYLLVFGRSRIGFPIDLVHALLPALVLIRAGTILSVVVSASRGKLATSRKPGRASSLEPSGSRSSRVDRRMDRQPLRVRGRRMMKSR